MFLKLANADINIAEWAKTQNCDHKIMYKFNDKSLARYKYNQSKPPETSTWATLVCSTQSPNLVSNSPYFPQVALCEAPRWDIPEKL